MAMNIKCFRFIVFLGYDGNVQEFEKHTYEPSRSFLTYESDLDNFNEDATSTEAQDNSQSKWKYKISRKSLAKLVLVQFRTATISR